MQIKIPRYISEGVKQPNGWLFDTDSMRNALTKAVESNSFVVYDYSEKEIKKNIKSTEPMSLHDQIGILTNFDNDFIYINVYDEYNFSFVDPVALISIEIRDCQEFEDYTLYFVEEIYKIDIAERAEL